MDHHLLLHCQSSPPSALLHHQSCNYKTIIPCSHVATIMLPCCHLAALIPPPPPLCCCRRPNGGRVHRCVTTKLPSPPLPPCRRHCHHHHRHCQPATASTKLPRCRYLHCEISLIMKMNSVTIQTLIAVDFLDYFDLAMNSCMGGCVQYSTP